MSQQISHDAAAASKWVWKDFQALYEMVSNIELNSSTVDEFLSKWTELCELVDEAFTRLHVATTRNTADEDAKSHYYRFLDEIYPNVEKQDHELKKKLLQSGLTPDGFQLPLKKMKTDEEIFREANLPLFTEEQKLGVAYSEVMAGQTVQWEGKEVTIAQLKPVFYQQDRSLRERAWKLARRRQMEDREKIGEIWSKLLEIRGQLAKNADFSDYRAYKWKQLKRFDYTPENCLEFHQAIEKVVSPVVRSLYAKRGKALGVESLRPWDLQVDEKGREGLSPFENAQELKDGARRIFGNVSDRLAKHFECMINEDLLDLENRKNKAPGGYCTDFAVQKRPFIFMNAVGVHDDVQTLLHEAGHCFHVFEKAGLPYYQQHETPMEFSEVASMAMELMASPYLARSKGGFYSENDAQRALKEHLEQCVMFWPYMAVVDGFQHWVYENPVSANSLGECGKKWVQLSERFMPGVDWSGLEEERANMWQRQIHIIEVPFYYVEYGLAQLGATQIWGRALQNQNEAVNQYLEALSLGGAVSLPELYETAGAKLSFDESALTWAMELIQDRLDRLDK